MSTVRNFKSGDFLFRQGEPSEQVLHLRAGQVEILREVGDTSILLGAVHEGEWLGEMAAVENRAHSATARAARDGSAEVLTVAEFLDQATRTPDVARDLILRLSVRLRSIEDKVASDLLPIMKDETRKTDDTSVAPGAGVFISAHTDLLKSLIGINPIRVTRFPFSVGRAPTRRESMPMGRPHLMIEDHEPFRLSRHHFTIDRDGSGLIVADHGSTLGTIVNGQGIGQHFMRDSAPLHHGENHVVAGGSDSPFQFVITV